MKIINASIPIAVGLVNSNSRQSNVSSSTDAMQEFFSDVEIVKVNIVEIRDATKKIAEINQNVLQATTNEREQDFSNELRPLVDRTNKKATVAKQMLQRLREDTESIKSSRGKQAPEVRIRENLGIESIISGVRDTTVTEPTAVVIALE